MGYNLYARCETLAHERLHLAIAEYMSDLANSGHYWDLSYLDWSTAAILASVIVPKTDNPEVNRRAVRSAISSSYEDILKTKIFEPWQAFATKIQSKYDLETNHSRIRAAQIDWEQNYKLKIDFEIALAFPR